MKPKNTICLWFDKDLGIPCLGLKIDIATIEAVRRG
jgi:hypothetical protein